MAGNTLSPPIAPASLHPPLSAGQKEPMLAFLVASGTSRADVAKVLEDTVAAGIGTFDLSRYVLTKSNATQAKTVDPAYIQMYSAVAAGGGVQAHPKVKTQAPSWIQNPLDFLKALASPALWVRVLEVLLGTGLILAGLAKLSGAADAAVKALPIAGKVLR